MGYHSGEPDSRIGPSFSSCQPLSLVPPSFSAWDKQVIFASFIPKVVYLKNRVVPVGLEPWWSPTDASLSMQGS